MKTITDEQVTDQLIDRINQLNPDSIPQWGKMNTYQMLRHLIMWEEMAMNKTLYKQSLFGRLIGKFALKDMMKDEPVKPNLPTVPAFRMSGDGDIAAEKARLISLLNEHTQYTGKGFMHPFFGQLTAEQAGFMALKHADHHLRQFGV